MNFQVYRITPSCPFSHLHYYLQRTSLHLPVVTFPCRCSSKPLNSKPDDDYRWSQRFRGQLGQLGTFPKKIILSLVLPRNQKKPSRRKKENNFSRRLLARKTFSREANIATSPAIKLRNLGTSLTHFCPTASCRTLARDRGIRIKSAILAR